MRECDVVVAIRGGEIGKRFLVLEVNGNRALLADGKRRRLEAPKAKNVKHLRYDGVIGGDFEEKLRSGNVTNAELRRCMARYRDNRMGG